MSLAAAEMLLYIHSKFANHDYSNIKVAGKKHFLEVFHVIFISHTLEVFINTKK